jgi:hypothetical protein
VTRFADAPIQPKGCIAETLLMKPSAPVAAGSSIRDRSCLGLQVEANRNGPVCGLQASYGLEPNSAFHRHGPDHEVEDPHLGEPLVAARELSLDLAQSRAIAIEVSLVAPDECGGALSERPR